MTLLMPTCAQAVALLTDYEEGALGPLDWLGLKLHLGLCPPCRAFLGTLHRTPGLLQALCDGTDPSPAAPAERALDGALAALRTGRQPSGPQHHPEEEAWRALEPGGDPLTALLLRVHLGRCRDCQGLRGPDRAIAWGSDPLAALRPHVAPETEWRWTRRGLGGAKVARILQNPATGASLHLAHLHGGGRMPMHRHAGPEVSLVLTGALQDGPAHLHPGDWGSAGPSTCHSPMADAGGCWALVRIEGGLRFTGWRSLLGAVG